MGKERLDDHFCPPDSAIGKEKILVSRDCQPGFDRLRRCAVVVARRVGLATRRLCLFELSGGESVQIPVRLGGGAVMKTVPASGTLSWQTPVRATAHSHLLITLVSNATLPRCQSLLGAFMATAGAGSA